MTSEPSHDPIYEIRSIVDVCLFNLELEQLDITPSPSEEEFEKHLVRTEVRDFLDDVLFVVEEKVKEEDKTTQITQLLDHLKRPNLDAAIQKILGLKIFEDDALLDKTVELVFMAIHQHSRRLHVYADFCKSLVEKEQESKGSDDLKKKLIVNFDENLKLTYQMIKETSEAMKNKTEQKMREEIEPNEELKKQQDFIKMLLIGPTKAMVQKNAHIMDTIFGYEIEMQMLEVEKKRMFQVLRFLVKFYHLGLADDLCIFYCLSTFKDHFWDLDSSSRYHNTASEIFIEYMLFLIQKVGLAHLLRQHTTLLLKPKNMEQMLCYDGCYLRTFVDAFLVEYRKKMSDPVKEWITEVQNVSYNNWKVVTKETSKGKKSKAKPKIGLLESILASATPKRDSSESPERHDMRIFPFSFAKKDVFEISETWMEYLLITKHFIEKAMKEKNQWIDDLLSNQQESRECLIFDDPDPNLGFVLAKDIKWLNKTQRKRKNLNNLYLLAIVRQKGLLSIRNLTSEHIPLLEGIRDKTIKVVQETYGIMESQLKFFFHYQPSTYHLHLHIVHENSPFVDPLVPQHWKSMFSLKGVIKNLKQASDFYQKETIAFNGRRGDPFTEEFLSQKKHMKKCQDGKEVSPKRKSDVSLPKIQDFLKLVSPKVGIETPMKHLVYDPIQSQSIFAEEVKA